MKRTVTTIITTDSLPTLDTPKQVEDYLLTYNSIADVFSYEYLEINTVLFALRLTFWSRLRAFFSAGYRNTVRAYVMEDLKARIVQGLTIDVLILL